MAEEATIVTKTYRFGCDKIKWNVLIRHQVEDKILWKFGFVSVVLLHIILSADNSVTCQCQKLDTCWNWINHVQYYFTFCFVKGAYLIFFIKHLVIFSLQNCCILNYPSKNNLPPIKTCIYLPRIQTLNFVEYKYEILNSQLTKNNLLKVMLTRKYVKLRTVVPSKYVS